MPNIEKLRQAGRLHRAIMTTIHQRWAINVGGFPKSEVEKFIKESIIDAGMYPAFMRVPGYEYASCISVNGEIVHGIPDDTIVREGDLASIDFGISNDGWIVDACESFYIGHESHPLIDKAHEVLRYAVSAARAGNSIRDVVRAVEKVDCPYKFQTGYYGHRIERYKLHVHPRIPVSHAPELEPRDRKYKFKVGDILAIEPMLVDAESTHCYVDENDGWTVRLSDPDGLAVQVENTVLVTEDEPEIFT